MTNEEYGRLADSLAPKSKCRKNCLNAFWTGGLICVSGQLVSDTLQYRCRLPEEPRVAGTAIVMVFLGAFLTGIGVYDRIGEYAGAGSVVPITGFANSVVSPAIEFKPEVRCIIGIVRENRNR